jgi:hypothetical protein
VALLLDSKVILDMGSLAYGVLLTSVYISKKKVKKSKKVKKVKKSKKK